MEIYVLKDECSRLMPNTAYVCPRFIYIPYDSFWDNQFVFGNNLNYRYQSEKSLL